MERHLNEKKLKLTGVIFEDANSSGFTGYFLELPGIIAEANTKEELREIMFDNLVETLENLAEDNQENIIGQNYSTESFEFAL